MEPTTNARPALGIARVESEGRALWAVRGGDEHSPLGLTLTELSAASTSPTASCC